MIDSPIENQRSESPAIEAEREVGQSAAPVIQQRAGETRITITQRSRAAAGPRPSTFESTDYSYVVGDLRRVTIVASALIVALIVLSLVIR
jgi:hypothetical protein